MPTDITEDSLDLTIDLLEAITPEPGDASYPFPKLKPAGRAELRQFRTVVLENPYLRVVVVPDLGGRIFQIQTKGDGGNVIPYASKTTIVEGGARGLLAVNGIGFAVTGEERFNGMGTVANAPDFAGEEDEPGGLWIGEVCGNGLSFSARIVLPPERAEIQIEFRLLNRTLLPIAINPGLILGLEFSVIPSGNAFLWDTEGVGLRIAADVPLHYRKLPQGRSSFSRFKEPALLAPRQLDSWTMTLTPYALPGGLSGMSSEAAAFFDKSVLKIQSVEQRLGHKIVLLTEDGQTLEAPADLYPETVYEVPLDTLPSPVKALAILDPARNEILRIEGDEPVVEPPADPTPLAIEWPSADWDEARLRQATFNIAQRHLAHLLLGYRALGRKDFAGASREFEQALLFNAEDHLTWWIKAVAARLAGDDLEERPELLNAHFLAPLEPALRAESYLVSPSHTKEASAVLRPLGETPDVFIDVACLLLEANLIEEASKWIDEALRHADLAMLRYLLAFAYLSASRMGVEAADQLAAAGKRPASPPYPYRAIERKALQALREQFPEDPVLAQYAAYLPV